MKWCSKCQQTKQLSEFYKNRARPDGVTTYCKVCQNKLQSNNLEKFREYNRKSYYKNQLARLGTCREHYAATIEEQHIRSKNYYSRKPYVAKKNCEIRRARIAGVGGTIENDDWEALKLKFNGLCACCGKRKKLTKDHVIPISKGGVNDISNIQPLCLSCNDSKGTKIIDYRGNYATKI